MREIDCEQIILAVKNLCINANCFLPADVRRAFAQLQTVYGKETRAVNPAFATQKTE